MLMRGETRDMTHENLFTNNWSRQGRN